MVNISPRDYQAEDLDKIVYEYNRGSTKQLVHYSTGLGKSILAIFLPKYFPELFDEGGMLVIAPRREIVKQFASKLQAMYPDCWVGIEMGTSYVSGMEDIVVTTAQSVGRLESDRLDKFKDPFSIIVSDEAHHASEGGIYDNTLTYFGAGSDGEDITLPSGRKPLSIFLSATPNREDKGLANFLDIVVTSRDIRWGVHNGWLVDIAAYQVQTELKESLDLFEQEDRAEALADIIVKGYFDYCEGLETLVFADSVDSSKVVRDKFVSKDIRAFHIDGTTDKEIRDKAIDQIRRGDVNVVTNYNVFSEGTDIPSLKALILARNTKSQKAYIQILGRALRPSSDAKVDSCDTAAERKASIAASSKPYALVVDVFDVTSSHKIVTVPDIFGLPSDFDSEGNLMIDEIADVILEEEEEKEGVELRDVRNMDDLELRLKKVDVWDSTVNNEEIQVWSPNRWVIEGDGDAASIWLPDHPNSGVKFTERTPHIFRVKQEGDKYKGQWIKVGGFVKKPQGGGFATKESVTESGEFDTIKDAIKTVDKKLKGSSVERKIRRDLTGDIRSRQKTYMESNGIKYSEDMDAESAQILIDNYRINRKVDKMGL